MSRPEPDRRRIGELLRNPNAARQRHVEQGLAAVGHAAIHPPHLPVFEYIDHDRGSRVTDLARHANVSAQAMSEVVAYLEQYAAELELPIELKSAVQSLSREDGTFVLQTAQGQIEAKQIVVATGPFQVPRVPPFAARLGPEVLQMHSTGYRNPSGVPEGTSSMAGEVARTAGAGPSR